MTTYYRLLTAFITLLISACSSTWQGATDTIKTAFAPAIKESLPDRKAVEQLPYYQIFAETEQTAALMILTRVAGKILYWQTGSEESLVINNGLIQRTTGLTDNLEQTTFFAVNPFEAGLHTIINKTEAVREIDLSSYRYGIRVSSVFHVRQIESIHIMDEYRELLRIDETISAPDIALFATNHYWVDNTGFIWKSVQTLWPGFSITITQLRPYIEDAL